MHQVNHLARAVVIEIIIQHYASILKELWKTSRAKQSIYSNRTVTGSRYSNITVSRSRHSNRTFT